METHGKARGNRDTFKERKGGGGKLKVWEWSQDDRILIRERINSSGGLGFRVVLPRSVTGSTELFFQSRDFDRAQEIARTKGREFRNSRSTANVLGDAQKIQCATAITHLEAHGLDSPLDAIAREYSEAVSLLKPFALSVPEAARMLVDALAVSRTTGKELQTLVAFATERLRPAGGAKTLAELAAEMVAMKRAWFERGELRRTSYKDFENRATKIARDIGGFPLAEVTKDLLIEWLAGVAEAGRTKKNYRMTLAELLRYAKQRRYLVDNPIEELTAEDVKTLEGRGGETTQPAILSPAQAEKLLAAAFVNPELDLGAAVVLGLFSGIRTEELKRLTWDAVRLDEKEPFVVIGPEIAKKRRIRNVTIPANAVAWLRRWKREEKVTRSTSVSDFQKRFRRLQEKAGFRVKDAAGQWTSTWEGNAMRHSFASYHYALHGNSIETARLLGHKADDSVLFSHYRALATKAQGEAYFAISPGAAAGNPTGLFEITADEDEAAGTPVELKRVAANA